MNNYTDVKSISDPFLTRWRAMRDQIQKQQAKQKIDYKIYKLSNKDIRALEDELYELEQEYRSLRQELRYAQEDLEQLRIDNEKEADYAIDNPEEFEEISNRYSEELNQKEKEIQELRNQMKANHINRSVIAHKINMAYKVADYKIKESFHQDNNSLDEILYIDQEESETPKSEEDFYVLKHNKKEIFTPDEKQYWEKFAKKLSKIIGNNVELLDF